VQHRPSACFLIISAKCSRRILETQLKNL